MLVAMPLPLTDLYHDGLSPWESCAELAGRDPDRTVFWGSVNPLEGRRALDLMERQVGEFGARAFKFYNVRYDYGSPYPWRMDDPRVAFPVFEKARELGVNLIGVHKGVPLGPQPIEHTQTWDMDGAAANFPDLNFIIFHVGLPFLDETCWQLIRYPNLYASLAATINFLVRAPRMFAEILGKLLFWCGEDKILYGSEAPIFHPQWALRAFMDFQIPEDLCAGYGYPATHRPSQTQDPRGEPATPARHGPHRRPDPARPQPWLTVTAHEPHNHLRLAWGGEEGRSRLGSAGR
jgi:predicted TIM-barrel fold metal-dependent hydrolase